MSRGPAKSFDRDAVLDQAMVEFWKRGYAATSVSILREATGLGAKSMYDTFGGKREVFLACLDRYGETVLPVMFDVERAKHPPRKALDRILRNLLLESAKGPARGCLLGVAAAELEDDPELSRALTKHLDKIRDYLAVLLEQLPLVKGAPTPHALASMLMTLLQGVHLISRVDGTKEHAKNAVATAGQLIDAYCA